MKKVGRRCSDCGNSAGFSEYTPGYEKCNQDDIITHVDPKKAVSCGDYPNGWRELK